MSANTAIHIVAWPATASSRNASLMPSARPMFCHSTACVRWDSAMVSGRRRRSSFMMSTSAASMAVSVPAAPIASPRSERASAGASLMPSPTIATRPCRCFSAAMACSFSSGSSPARTVSMPAWAATWRAVASLSPVSITGVMSCARKLATASAACGRKVSATASKASTRWPSASSVTVRPACSCTASRASSAGLHCPRSSIQR